MTPAARWLVLGTMAVAVAMQAVVAVAQAPAPLRPALPARPPGAEIPKPPTAEIPTLPALEDLSETVERPLFVRSRKPPPPPTATVAAEPARVTVASEDAPAELTGIVSGPERTYAILVNRSTKETLHLRQGEKIDDWSVQEIGPRYVVLQRGPGNLRIELFEEKGHEAGATGEDGQSRRPPNMQRFTPQTRRQPQRAQQQQQRRQVRRPQRRNNNEDE